MQGASKLVSQFVVLGPAGSHDLWSPAVSWMPRSTEGRQRVS